MFLSINELQDSNIGFDRIGQLSNHFNFIRGGIFMTVTRELCQQEMYVNRQYKDRLFKLIFRKKEFYILQDYIKKR